MVNGEEKLLFKANNYFFSIDDLPNPLMCPLPVKNKKLAVKNI
jgi:hypothetical protein